MELTKRQEKQLNKVFNNPKQLRKFIDEIERDLIVKYEEEYNKKMGIYIDIYNVAIAFTAHETLGLGRKRLIEFMQKIYNNLECFESGHLSLEDCIGVLKHYGISFDNVLQHSEEIKKRWNRVGKIDF